MADDCPASGLIVNVESRALKCALGALAWAVLEDVSLDAVLQDGRWLAATSTRRLAEHLGLTPGTVARALARLRTEGLVHREDRRDTHTGRFGESVYVVAPTQALTPCVDSPPTVHRTTDTPNTVRPVTVLPNAAPPKEAPSSTEGRLAEPAPEPSLISSSRRRSASAEQQLLLGDGGPA